LRRAIVLGCLVALIAGCGRIVVLGDPLSPEEHNDLGVAYEARGEMDLAAREYRRALRQRPRFVTARINLGNVCRRMGSLDDAEREYRRALADAPASPEACNNLAALLAERGLRLEEAERLARSALQADTSRSAVYAETLGEVLEAAGKEVEARRAFEEALAHCHPERDAALAERLRLRLSRRRAPRRRRLACSRAMWELGWLALHEALRRHPGDAKRPAVYGTPTRPA
jgi:Tfp pilus assembly protein PilF